MDDETVGREPQKKPERPSIELLLASFALGVVVGGVLMVVLLHRAAPSQRPGEHADGAEPRAEAAPSSPGPSVAEALVATPAMSTGLIADRVRYLDPEDEALERPLAIIRAELARYKNEALEGVVDRVVLYREIARGSRDGVRPIGGTYAPRLRSVYLAIDPASWSRYQIAGVLHAEISSLFAYSDAYRFPWSTWEGFSGRGAYAGYDGNRAHDLGADALDPGPRFAERGFWNQYASSSVEEDLNYYVLEMMAAPCVAEAWFERYPLMREKAAFVRAYYGRTLRAGADAMRCAPR